MTPSPGAEPLLDHVATGWRPWLLLVLLCFSLYLPGIATLPPVDRDESRYVQATKQMLETGDFVRIRFQDEARNKKPAGIYWLQAAAVALLGGPERGGIWRYRVVSVGGATLAVLLTFGFGSAIFDRRAALIGAGLLAAAADLVFEAHVATTDAVLLPAAVTAQGALGLAYLGARRGETLPARLALAFWLAEGFGLMIKGPVLPALSLLTASFLVAVDRRVRWLGALRPLWGLPLALAIAVPWLALIEAETGGAFLGDAVGHDFADKLVGGQEAHGAPPGYYLALLPVTFWPGSLFLGAVAVWAWRSRRLPASRLLAAWVLPFWLALELVPTKLPHYVLPLYPALALAAGRAVLAGHEVGLARAGPWPRRIAAGLWALVAAGFGLGLAVLPLALGSGPSLAGAVGLAGTGAVLWWCFVTERGRIGLASVPVAIVAALVGFVPALQYGLPPLDPLWLSRSAGELVAAEREGVERVSASGYAEPSLVFLLGTDTSLAVPGEAAAELARGEVALSLVSDDGTAEFEGELARRGAAATALGAVRGFDYSNGKWLTLTLYRLAH
jgi:4-amino-4-deoxy-L-arabinose transferase-like glycosyltransferase